MMRLMISDIGTQMEHSLALVPGKALGTSLVLAWPREPCGLELRSAICNLEFFEG